MQTHLYVYAPSLSRPQSKGLGNESLDTEENIKHRPWHDKLPSSLPSPLALAVGGLPSVTSRQAAMIKLFSLKQQTKEGVNPQSSKKTSAAYLRIQKGTQF